MVFKTVLFSLVIFALMGILYTQQDLIIEEKRVEPLLIQELKPVNPKLIRPFLFGHEAFYADLFWIDTIQKSVKIGTPHLFEYLYQMIDLITDLDPRFSQVYIWSNSALEFSVSADITRKERVEKSNELLLKGWNYVQQDPIGWNYYRNYWMIAQLLAYNYGFELGNKEKALEYTSILMYVPGLPPHLKTWAAGLYRKSKDQEKGVNFLENLLAVETIQAQINMLDDKGIKEKLKGKLLVFYKNLKSDSYGYQRIFEIQEQVRDLVETWRKNYLFLPFSFYTLIHHPDRNVEKLESNEIYNIFFPSLARPL